MIALLLKYGQGVAIAALLAFGVHEWNQHNATERALGAAQEKNRILDSTLTVLATAKAQVETVTVRDSIRFTRFAEHTVTLHDTVLSHLTDTVLVKQFVASSDSTIHACHELLNDCAESKRLSAREINALRAKLAVQPATIHRSSFGATVLHVGLGVLVAEAYHAIRR